MARAKGAAREGDGRAGRRSAARLAAVQALYEMELADAPADPVLEEFLAHRWSAPATPEQDLARPDEVLLADLVRGASARMPEVDPLIAAALTGNRTLARLEALVRAILRAATYELLARVDTPARVAISEYVDVAHAFFAGGEPGLVNGVLDAIARKLRPEDFKSDVKDASDGGPQKNDR